MSLLDKLLNTTLTVDQETVIKKHYLDLLVKKRIEQVVKELTEHISSLTIKQLIEQNEEYF